MSYSNSTPLQQFIIALINIICIIMTCSTRLVNKWRTSGFARQIASFKSCKRLECSARVPSRIFWSFSERVGGAQWRGQQNQSPPTSPHFRFDGAFVLGREDAYIYTTMMELTKTRAGRWKRPILRFRATSFRPRRKLFHGAQSTIRILHMNAFWKRRAAMNEWLSRTRALTKKNSRRTNNIIQIGISISKAWRYYSNPHSSSGWILAILLHRALRFAHQWYTFFNTARLRSKATRAHQFRFV